jgi:hypothetical protein
VAKRAWGATAVSGMNLVNSVRVGRTTFDYTYTISVTNDATALANATATVTSSSPATVIVRGTVALGNVAANFGSSVTCFPVPGHL